MSAPIRVLELRSVRGTGGGPEKTILLGARRADRARFAVTVCYIRDLRDDDFSIDQRADQLGVDYVEIRERHSLDPAVWPALRRLVRDRQIQIVHSHEYKTNGLAYLLSFVEAIVPLATVHGWFGCDTFRERVYYALDKRVLARFPRLIAVSGELRNELVRTGCRPDRVTVVSNGIDPRLFVRDRSKRDAVRASLGVAADQFVIGAVGRLETQKRFDLLMEAFAALSPKTRNLRLVIVGDGGLKEDLASIRDRLNLGDTCLLLGHRTDVPALHAAFDLFVQASDFEGSPNVLLEAMALESPAVATDCGGTSDLIVDGVHGLIVPPGDRDALTRAMEKVLSDVPAAAARARAARQRVEDEFTFDRRMDRVESIYEELATPSVTSGSPAVAATR